MEKRAYSIRAATWHTVLVVVVLCAFFLRAIIASGYMPAQPATPGEGRPGGVMLCVTGLPGALAKAFGLTDDHHDSTVPHCAFGSLLGHAALLLLALGLVLFLAGVGRPFRCVFEKWLVKPSRCGPPVGSRAPPCA